MLCLYLAPTSENWSNFNYVPSPHTHLYTTEFISHFVLPTIGLQKVFFWQVGAEWFLPKKTRKHVLLEKFPKLFQFAQEGLRVPSLPGWYNMPMVLTSHLSFKLYISTSWIWLSCIWKVFFLILCSFPYLVFCLPP